MSSELTAYQWFVDGKPVKHGKLSQVIRLLFEEGHTIASAKDYLYTHTKISSSGILAPHSGDNYMTARRKLSIDYHIHWFLKGESYAADEG